MSTNVDLHLVPTMEHASTIKGHTPVYAKEDGLIWIATKVWTATFKQKPVKEKKIEFQI